MAAPEYDPAPFLALGDDSVDMTSLFLDIEVRAEGRSRADVELRLYVLGMLVAARELMAGVCREVRAGAMLNAIRLARHLYEHSLDLAYVLDNPPTRLAQTRSREAVNRTDVADAHEIVFPDTAWQEELRGVAEQSERADKKARRKRSKGNPVAADELGAPSFQVKADALGRGADHRQLYGASSWISHPGIGSYECYLDEDPTGSVVRVRPLGLPKPELADTAMALGLTSFVSMIEAAGGVLGPFPELSKRLALLVATEFPDPLATAKPPGADGTAVEPSAS